MREAAIGRTSFLSIEVLSFGAASFRSKPHCVLCPKNVMTRQPGTASLWWAPMQRRNLRSRTTSGRTSELDFFVAPVEYDEGATTTMTMTLTVAMTMR